MFVVVVVTSDPQSPIGILRLIRVKVTWAGLGTVHDEIGGLEGLDGVLDSGSVDLHLRWIAGILNEDPVGAVRDGYAPVVDKYGMLDTPLWHISAEKGAVLVVLHQHVDRVVIDVHGYDVQGSPACPSRVHRELRPLVCGVSCFLEARS